MEWLAVVRRIFIFDFILIVMKKKNWIIIAILVLVIWTWGSIFFEFNRVEVDVNDFESCLLAGNPAMESYPRQCMHDGVNYVEEIKEKWRNDGIELRQHEIEGFYGCFGCNIGNPAMCVDPVPEMIFAEENQARYCTNDFEVVEVDLLEICPDEWILNQMPCGGEGCNEFPREYFIIDGERRELEEFNVDWIKENCDLMKQVAY